MGSRVTIFWTETAKETLKKLPLKVRKGLLDKADELLQCEDPRKHCKPLVGPLQGYYRIVYSRYRAVFTVEEELQANGEVHLHLKVIFIVAGVRKEYDRNDVYRIALKLAKHVLPEREAGDSQTRDEEMP